MLEAKTSCHRRRSVTSHQILPFPSHSMQCNNSNSKGIQICLIKESAQVRLVVVLEQFYRLMGKIRFSTRQRQTSDSQSKRSIRIIIRILNSRLATTAESSECGR